jgi:predicted nucleic acid-binding protein
MESLPRSGGIVDTDILIDASRDRAEALAFLNRLRAGAKAYISVITAMELAAGARDSRDLRELRRFIGQFYTLDIVPDISKAAYRLVVNYGLSHGMRPPDALIAATCLAHGLTLYTKNIRHFRMIPGLPLVRPY